MSILLTGLKGNSMDGGKKRTAVVILILLILLTFLSLFYFHSPLSKKKNYVIGILNPNPKLKHVVEGFISGMSGYGYIEDKEDADAIFILNSPFIISNIDLILKSAIKHGLPTASGAGQYKNGVLITYGQDHFNSGKMASRLAHAVLQGASPGDMPVETTEFFLGINLQTAGAIGLEIPDNVLQQADFIIR
ncbi:MAG: hypothetical protein HZA14_09740 [Nitrospirae bacterium]|nr:hypothetical protein [Nitrospirota bacterium]